MSIHIINMKIIVDSREKKSYKFSNSIRKKLDVGDYSCENYENKICIERKSLSDWVGCCIGKNRERLEKEISKAKETLDFFAIVIESDIPKIWSAKLYSKIPKQAIINTAIAWQVKWDIPIIFASDRTTARKVVYKLLECYVEYDKKKGK